MHAAYPITESWLGWLFWSHVTGLLMRALGSDWPSLKLKSTIHSKPKLRCQLRSEEDARVSQNY